MGTLGARAAGAPKLSTVPEYCRVAFMLRRRYSAPSVNPQQSGRYDRVNSGFRESTRQIDHWSTADRRRALSQFPPYKTVLQRSDIRFRPLGVVERFSSAPRLSVR